MVVVGLGSIPGGFIIGFITDHLGGGRSVALSLVVLELVRYCLMIAINEVHEFNFLCLFTSVIYGMVDMAVFI